MSDLEFEIFKDKKYKDLLEDIYNKSKERDRQIEILINELKPLIKNLADATIIVPLIKEYLDIGVKNDEHIIKLTALVQRTIQAQRQAQQSLTDPTKINELGLTDAEIQAIEKEIQDKVKLPATKDMKALSDKKDKVLKNIKKQDKK